MSALRRTALAAVTLALAVAAPAAAEISFVPPASFPAPDAEDVVTADFNDDGLLDVAVDNTQRASASVLLGDGQANLGSPITFSVPGHPADLAAADFNGDGAVDVAVTGQETGNVTIAPGEAASGAFTFGTPYDVPAAPNAYRLAVGLVNADSSPDLVVTDGNAASVDVLIADGTGGFAAPVPFAVADVPLDVAMGDLNHDGFLDIVTVGGSSISVLLGDGNGGFAAATTTTTLASPFAVALTDYNRDGNLDAVLGAGSNGVLALAGAGNGQFQAQQGIQVPGSFVGSVATGDLDGDGDPDIAGVTGAFTIESNGDGTFQPAHGHDGQGVRLRIADLDGDGMNDLVLASNQHVVVLGNNSSPPPPVVGKSANVAPVSGKVLVKLPGGSRFVQLEAADHIPVGAQVDTRKGTVRVTTAAGGRKTQTGRFRGGLFKLKQSRKHKLKPVTELQLTGRLRCARTHGAVRSSASRSRRLFGDAHGRFRTRGRHSTATVRGTKWLVKDTCSGTLTRSLRGTVVVRDLVKHTTHVLHTGQHYLARRGNR